MLKAIIVYLSRRKDLNDLQKSLLLLHENFNKKYNYPIIIFNDDFNNDDEQKLLKINPNIKFERIIFEIPPWIDKKEPFKTEWGIGYRHMCRFFSGELFKHKSMKKFDWYWRLDSDSFIHSEIKYDIFKFMDEEGYIYGYLGTTTKEGARVVEGLWSLTKEFILINEIQPKFLHRYIDNNGYWDYTQYYTNFEISKLDFWRSDDYMNYFNYIDQNGGIYYNRWGDAPIHLLAISIFVDEIKIHCFKDIDYSHTIFRPNRDNRLYSMLKKFKIYNYINKSLYFLKYNKIYDIIYRHLISKFINLINFPLNYKLIRLQVYDTDYN